MCAENILGIRQKLSTPRRLEDLKVKQNTIVKISNGTIIKYYEEDEIKNNL